MATVTDTDTAANLTQFLYRASLGEEIIIKKDGEPLARLMPLEERPPLRGPRKLGMLAGQGWIGPDFDDPLPDEIMRSFE